ncbi:SubName: Full=Related to interferon-induced double-stranded RNA-activated protein kinase inhibitor {ECO:0000313/EMBL:CCA75835.1} [Serendipita indica DSM 11827]|uniref:Related to interferon-induced double-stranded RNA-activated protein kinase inhibitor n=1 Tax=Serendipita indica (strain DSM 11827) TaxID=1109443 RepID=G4TWZ2_SERID|nr:SubName: Full=Related to interferon-induced double-stranded RNA-activated protein kinase inhibitor {ECO:0000313/EMBL:CCA75835.1} [Serendipita indica DSM 11827]CCA75835.1 related to interferon-induced double-stranded RNA-activated protein kinase inhibitor [Serendipita indica DSM 11827]
MRLISTTTSLLLLLAPHRILADNTASGSGTSTEIPSTAAPTATESSTQESQTPQLKPLITRANVLLSAGQFADAARTYSEALELAPNDYLLYFKRATAYLSSNRHAPALEDFDTVLRLTDGNFDGAVIAKAKIYAKEGRWTESKAALVDYSKRVPGDKSAQDLMFAVNDSEIATKKAASAQKAGKWEACIESATLALQTAVYSSSLRQQRADCALAAGDVEQAIADMTRLTHLGITSTPLLLRISALSYFLSPASPQGLATLKQCLHYDPDSKPCKAAHRQLKALDKQFKQLEDAGEDWRKIVKIVTQENTGLAAKFDQVMNDILKTVEPPLPTSIHPSKSSQRRAQIWRAACKAYVQLNDVRKGEKWCAEVLRMDPEDVDGLVGSGEAAIKNEEWEEAVRLFDRAFNASGKSSHDIHGRLQRAQRLLKQAKKKDYYKVLGVGRDADPKTIKKAYRKAAMNAHPDKGGNEAKMAAVNEAYEVLSNPELKQRYDNGDDPNDPESQHGGHPFQGQPFFFNQGGREFRNGFPGGGFAGGFPGGGNFEFKF